MTLAVGVACPQGAVVAVDSLRFFYPDGRIEPRIVDDKLLVSPRFVCAPRGGSLRSWGPLPSLPSDFDEAAACVWRFAPPTWPPGSVRELIAAGGPVGQPVQLALLSNQAEPRFAPSSGGFLIAGAEPDFEPPDATGWWPPPQPRTLDECVTTALQLCFEIIRRNLVRVLDRDDIPGAAWPVHLAVVTAETIELRIYDETAVRAPEVAW